MPHKVLHVIRRLDVAGGAERIVASLVRYSNDHDVLVFDGGESFFDLNDRKIFRSKSIFHALLHCIRLRRSYGTIHLHLFPAIYFALFLGNKAIIHEHNTHNARRNFAVFRPIEWLVYRRARSVLAISSAASCALRRWVGPGPTINILMNFVKPRQNLLSKQGIAEPNSDVQLLMVASFTSQKRQDLLLKSLVRLPEHIHLSLVGEGPTLKDCKDLSVKLKLSDRVKFLGAVKNVEALYAQADLCLLLSHWEGFGLVVLEAAQYGVPTLASDVEGLREICPEPSLLFKGEDANDLAEHILHLLNAKNQHISADQLMDFAETFSLDEYMKCLSEIYITRPSESES
ncbi:MAG: glycosyltransferase family 4 protein [Gammaproteobacteria bacterium]|nr:glycosyltransferase family 4 protein [Gammaproteobacteria bacterium]MBU1838165.1 glycosyltransferase family 4 protein [Alphaproteobacteria bacterium]